MQTTTLFQENSHVSEDVDYAFLQKFYLGHGTFGDAWRVWFYSTTRQCEADIVVKEVTLDPVIIYAIFKPFISTSWEEPFRKLTIGENILENVG